jgi:hypothetical protein
MHADTKSADERQAEWEAVDTLQAVWVCFLFVVCLFFQEREFKKSE